MRPLICAYWEARGLNALWAFSMRPELLRGVLKCVPSQLVL